VNQALAADPTSKPAADLKSKIELTQKLTELTKSGAENTSPQVREELKNTYTTLSKEQIANPRALEALSKAKVMLEAKPESTYHAK
jgi:hypothetical protein